VPWRARAWAPLRYWDSWMRIQPLIRSGGLAALMSSRSGMVSGGRPEVRLVVARVGSSVMVVRSVMVCSSLLTAP